MEPQDPDVGLLPQGIKASAGLTSRTITAGGENQPRWQHCARGTLCVFEAPYKCGVSFLLLAMKEHNPRPELRSPCGNGLSQSLIS